jgi:Flp pilus assembly secretin CpaC
MVATTAAAHNRFIASARTVRRAAWKERMSMGTQTALRGSDARGGGGRRHGGTVARWHGGTVAIGGIYSTDEREDVTRVPLLGKIPVLGWLFRHTARRNPRSERVIFITPHIVPARL